MIVGIVSGRSTMLLGKIEDGTGVEVKVQKGDVIVLPAGTAHSSLESAPDYFYIGVYPRVSHNVLRLLLHDSDTKNPFSVIPNGSMSTARSQRPSFALPSERLRCQKRIQSMAKTGRF